MKTFFAVLFLGVLVALSGCRKDSVFAPEAPLLPSDSIPSNYTFSFDSLYGSGKAHINTDYTIYAVATGSELSYDWTINSATIENNGSSAILNTCCVGDYIVTCTVSDFYGNSGTRELSFYVGN